MRTIIGSVVVAGLLASLVAGSASVDAKPKPKNPKPAAPSGPCADPDIDNDGHASLECGGDDCDDASAKRYPGAAEICDAADIDEDCNPATYGIRDADSDGYGDARCCNGDRCGLDCDDARTNVNPRASEVCNGRDDNCDRAVDEDLRLTVWRDEDRDLYGNPSESMQSCPQAVPKGWVTNDYDCDDHNVRLSPRSKCP